MSASRLPRGATDYSGRRTERALSRQRRHPPSKLRSCGDCRNSTHALPGACQLVKKSHFLNEWHSSRRIDSQRDVTTGFTVAARERRFNPQKLSACTSNSTSLCISCPLSGPPAPARRGARGGAARFKIAENRSQSEDYRHATTPDPTQPNQSDFMPIRAAMC